MVFDSPMAEISFEERQKFLNENRLNFPPFVQLVNHIECLGHDHLQVKFHIKK